MVAWRLALVPAGPSTWHNAPTPGGTIDAPIDYVDTHVHLWNTAVLRYPWLDDHPEFGATRELSDYLDATGDEPPGAFVFVQAGVDDADAEAETRWVDAMCSEEPRYAGAVTWAPVRDGAEATGAHLDALDACRLVGVRELIQGTPPGYCNEPRFVDAVDAIGTRGLTFDVCVEASQLAEVAALAAAVPETRLVLDHLGKPPIAGGDWESWRTDIRTLARFDHVWCKLSGLLSEAGPLHGDIDHLRPFVDEALDAFGPTRVMWGSDWPVVNGVANHERWQAISAELLAGLSASDRRSVYRETAHTAYRLDPTGMDSSRRSDR